MLKLRLTRLGDKKRPSYRIIAMKLYKRDGQVVAYLGNYFPLEDSKVVLKEEEILNFLANGAQPTRTVKSILVKAGVWQNLKNQKENN